MSFITGFLEFKKREISLKQQMIMESNLINSSVEWLKNKIDQKLLEIDVAEDQYNYTEIERLKGEVVQLLSKLDREDRNMTCYMEKYKQLINNETKELLSYLSQAKPSSLRSVPSHPIGKTQGSGIPINA